MAIRLLLVALALSAAGCAGFDIQRLAPPGIIRYERIADEKEPNPAVEAEVRAYRQRDDAAFPIVGETAAAGPQPDKPPASTATAGIDQLEAARNALNAAVEADRAAAREDLIEAERVSEAGVVLAHDVEVDMAEAKRETETALDPSADEDDEQ